MSAPSPLRGEGWGEGESGVNSYKNYRVGKRDADSLTLICAWADGPRATSATHNLSVSLLSRSVGFSDQWNHAIAATIRHWFSLP